jgi:hypothetical protein
MDYLQKRWCDDELHPYSSNKKRFCLIFPPMRAVESIPASMEENETNP